MSSKDQRIILVVGISGSGKTTYSEGLGLPLIHFDKEIHSYTKGETSYENFQAWIKAKAKSPTIVVDAWVLNKGGSIDKFFATCRGENRRVELRVVYTSPVELYLAQRQKQTDGHYKLSPSTQTLRSHARVWQKKTAAYLNRIKDLREEGYQVRWIFRQGGKYQEFPDQTHILSMVALDPIVELMAWIKAKSGDPKYHTIEVDGEILCRGYTRPEKSWERIEAWGLDWQGKTVGDMGCFNGFFCFQAEKAGASTVTGFDRGQGPVDIASRLAKLHGSRCKFVRRDLMKEAISEQFDVTLVMNALHHIMRKYPHAAGVQFLMNVFGHSQAVLFEIERDTEGFVTETAEAMGFRLTHEAESHRVTAKGVRRLLYFDRRNSVDV